MNLSAYSIFKHQKPGLGLIGLTLLCVLLASCELPDDTNANPFKSEGISTGTEDNAPKTPSTGSAVSANSTITGLGPTVADGSSSSIITITLKDANGSGVSGVNPTFSATNTNGGNAYSLCSESDSSGISACTLKSTYAETKTLSITSPVSKTGGTVTFTSQGPASTISFSTQPADSTASQDFTTMPIVEIKDANGAVVQSGADATATITLTLISGTGVLTGTVSKAAVAGVADFTGTGLQINLSGAKTLRATKSDTSGFSTGSTSKTVDSSSFTISAGAASAATSTITGTSSIVANGTDSSTITITLLDTNSNPISGTTPTFSATDTGARNTYDTCSASDSSGVSTCTLKSTYAEVKTLSLVTPVAVVGSTVTFTSAGLNLEVPIEMIEYGLASKNSTAQIFDHTLTSLNTSDYNGTVTYSFEVITQNNHATNTRVVSLLNSSGSTVASISVPTQNTIPTRMRTSFTPTSGANNYKIQLDGNGGNNDFFVYSARIIIHQTSATTTKIYIPLLSGSGTVTSNSTTVTVDTTSSTTFTQGSSANFPIYLKNSNLLKTLSTTPWTFEAVFDISNSSTTADIALFNKITNMQVTGTTLSTSSTTPILQSVSFNDNAAQFTDGDEFEVRLKSNNPARNANLMKAGLWVKLTNLTDAEIPFRVGKQHSVTGSNIFDHARALFDNTLFSNPTVYYESTGVQTNVTGGDTSLYTHGNNDSDTAGSTLIGGSTITYATTRSRQRSGSLTLTDGERFITNLNRTAGTVTQTSGNLMIQITQ